MTNLHILPTRPPRISPRLRHAIELRVTRGMSISDACDKAGISRAGFHKAMKRPAVVDLVAQTQASFIAGTETLRSTAKRQALETALDLMRNAKSEAIRARMAEFLAADAKLSPVAVHIDARSPGGAYEYLRPGQRIVDAGLGTERQRIVDIMPVVDQE